MRGPAAGERTRERGSEDQKSKKSAEISRQADGQSQRTDLTRRASTPTGTAPSPLRCP